MYLDLKGVIALEVLIATLMKVNPDRHDCTGSETGGPPPNPVTGVQWLLLPLRLELWAEIIDRAEARA